ncbi:hypothetical protein [Nitrososphaera sp. AFS]|nr:hypothetical protein [Nitrososphaera sp. AFS]
MRAYKGEEALNNGHTCISIRGDKFLFTGAMIELQDPLTNGKVIF